MHCSTPDNLRKPLTSISPTRPARARRLRVRVHAGSDGWAFVITTTERQPIAVDFGVYPDFAYWTRESRALHALIRAREFLLRKFPSDDPESLVCLVNVATAREPREAFNSREKGRRAA